MVRGNLGAALQGFVALPLLAGYDLDDPDPQAAGRIVSFDAAGGWNIEEEGYQSVGSGSIFAKSSIKKLYSQVVDADSALRVAVEALYDAADDDSATGGPDLVRGIYPTAVVIGAEGAEEVPEERIAELAREVIESRSRADTFRSTPGRRPMRGETRELSVFHLARAGDARAFGARAQGHCPGPQRGGACVCRRRAVRRREPVALTAEGQRAVRPCRVRGRRAGSTSSTTCAAAASSSPTPEGYAYDRRDVTGRQLANVYAQTLGTIFTEQAKPYEVELCVAEVAHYGETKPPELYRITYDGSIADEPHFVVMGGTTEPITTALNESYTENANLSEAVKIAVDALKAGGNGSEARSLGPSTLEVAILDVNRPRRAFRRITGSALEALLPEEDSGSADQKSDGD